MNNFNDWLADHLTNILSAMWLFWIMNILIWTAILIQRPHDLQSWLLAIISVWFQGVSLVIINRTSQKQGDRMEKVIREIEGNTKKEMTILKKSLRYLMQIAGETKKEQAEIKEIMKKIGCGQD